jgi:hypothetical protein
LSTQYDYHIQCTTREGSTLTGLIGPPSRLGRRGCWHINQPSLSRRLLLGLCSRCLLHNSSGRCSALLSNRGLARQLRQEFIYGGGWAVAGSSWLSHCVSIAFVTLLNGVGRRHLLQVREFRRQHTTSRHKYSTTLFKTADLLGRGLCDLLLLGHALTGHVARPPWRRGQTSL